jgi:hypothetical protein
MQRWLTTVMAHFGLLLAILLLGTQARAESPNTGTGGIGPAPAHTEPSAVPSAQLLEKEAAQPRPLIASWGKLDQMLTVKGNGRQQVSITPARALAPALPPVALHLLEFDSRTSPAAFDKAFADGKAELELEFEPDKPRYIRLLGSGFVRPATYQAQLVLGAAPPAALSISVETPPGGLGLHATQWHQGFTVFPVFQKRELKKCIETDIAAKDAIHAVLEAPVVPRANSLRIPPDAVKVASEKSCHGVSVQVSGLGPGSYDGTLDIEGQKLSLQLSLRPPSILLFFGILLGAFASMSVRRSAAYFGRRAANEAAVADVERNLPRWAMAWDNLLLNNALRRARGNNRLFGLDNVRSWLDIVKAGSPSRPELDVIVNALNVAPLPAMMREALNLELSHLRRLSSSVDADELDKGLRNFAAAAAEGFRGRFANWLGALRLSFDDWRRRLKPRVAALPDQELRELTFGVLDVLWQLIHDAQEILNDRDNPGIGIEYEHVAILERITLTLAWLDATVGPDLVHHRKTLVDLLYCKIDSSIDAEKVSSPTPAPIELPRDCGITMTPPRALALAEQNFVVAPLPPAVWRLRFRWLIQTLNQRGEVLAEDIVEGGPRLTWVFAERDTRRAIAPRAAKRQRVRVEVLAATATDKLTKEGSSEGPAPLDLTFSVFPDVSALKSLRIQAWIAEQGALVTGTVIAGAVAVLYWMGKPFDWSDYVNLIVAGIGVDASTSSATVRSVMARLVPDGKSGKLKTEDT